MIIAKHCESDWRESRKCGIGIESIGNGEMKQKKMKDIEMAIDTC